jgi:hypothetical protein
MQKNAESLKMPGANVQYYANFVPNDLSTQLLNDLTLFFAQEIKRIYTQFIAAERKDRSSNASLV